MHDQTSETTAGVPQCLNLIYNSLRVGLELVILAFIFNEEVYLDVKTLLYCLLYNEYNTLGVKISRTFFFEEIWKNFLSMGRKNSDKFPIPPSGFHKGGTNGIATA